MVELSKKEERPRIAKLITVKIIVALLFSLRFIRNKSFFLLSPRNTDFVMDSPSPHST